MIDRRVAFLVGNPSVDPIAISNMLLVDVFLKGVVCLWVPIGEVLFDLRKVPAQECLLKALPAFYDLVKLLGNLRVRDDLENPLLFGAKSRLLRFLRFFNGFELFVEVASFRLAGRSLGGSSLPLGR